MAESKVGSNVQSFPSSRGPFDGNLFVFYPNAPVVDDNFYTLVGGVFGGTTAGYWRMLRQVRDFVITKNEEKPIIRQESRKGKNVPLEGFYRQRRPTIEFVLGEQYDPYSLQMGMGDDNTPVAVGHAKPIDKFLMSLHGTKRFPLPVEFNLDATLANPGSTVLIDTFTTGGHVPALNPGYWCITAVYNGIETLYSASVENHIVTTGSTSIVILNWSLVALTAVPDSWNIYRGSAAGTYPSSALVGSVPGSVMTFIDTLATCNVGTPPLVAAPFLVKDITGATPYVINVDYTLDITEGTLQRIATGAILDGQTVLLQFLYDREEGIVIPFDEGRFKSYHLPVMFLGQQSGSRSRTDIVRFIFDSVDWTPGAEQLNASAEFDATGLKFTLDVHYNPNTGRFGEMGTFVQQIEGFTQINLT